MIWRRVVALRGWFAILAFGGVPLLWFRDGLIATGGDHVFPLDPVSFFRNRLNTWDPRLGVGTPKGIHPATIVWHGIQAAVYRLGFSPIDTQRITYVLWFTALAAAAYGFVQALQRIRGERPSCTAGLVAAAAYTLNPLMFNIWEAGKAGEISAAVGLPVVLTIMALVCAGRCAIPLGAALIGVIAVLVSEWGSPPILGAVFLCLASYAVSITTVACWRGRRAHIRRLLLFLGLVLVVVTAVSMYWWLPMIAEVIGLVRTAGGEAGAFTKIEAIRIGTVGFANWLTGISTHTSLFNVMRLQGIWDWYYTWGEIPYVPYARHFFGNPVLLLLSVGVPIGAYLAVVLRRDFHTLWCAATAVIFTILACGTHPPTGALFRWLVDHVPGFTVFRSPFYKFGLVIILMYAGLLGTTVFELARRWKARGRPPHWVTVTALCGIGLYGFPMFTGAILPKRAGTALASIKLDIPGYVFDAARWLRQEAKPGRIMTLPEQSSDSYRWGFSSSLPLLNYLVDRSILQLAPQGYPAYLQKGNQVLLHLFVHAVEQGSTTRAAAIARRLGVRYLLVRRDSTFDLAGRPDAGRWIEQRLKLQEGLTLRRVFGEWAFYEVEDDPLPPLYTVSHAQILTGEVEGLVPLATAGELDGSPAFLFANDLTPEWLAQIPCSRIIWCNTQLGDTILEQIPHRIEQPLQVGEPYEVTIPETGEYLVGILRPLDEPTLTPPTVLLDQQRVLLPQTIPWLPPTERWILYDASYLTDGPHRLNIIEHGGRSDTHTLMVVPLAAVESFTHAWMTWVAQPDHALFWFFSSEVMATAIREPASPVVDVVFSGSAMHEMSPRGIPWAPSDWFVIGGQSPHLWLVNHSPVPQWVSLSASVSSLGTPRDLTIYVGSIKSPLATAAYSKLTIPRTVFVTPMRLPPGDTPVVFYTPSMATAYPTFEGSQYLRGTFAVREVHVGSSLLQKTLYLPRRDTYTLVIHRFLSPHEDATEASASIEVRVDGRAAPLAGGGLTLDPGLHTVTVAAPPSQAFGLQLATPAPPPTPVQRPAFTRLSPTHVRVTGLPPTPQLLVFRDAYDENWGLSRFLRAPHVTVDGYANGWWINERRAWATDIEYAIQRIFHQAAVVSAGTVAACLLTIAMIGLRAIRARPRTS